MMAGGSPPIPAAEENQPLKEGLDEVGDDLRQ
jgi:hypothetical protein